MKDWKDILYNKIQMKSYHINKKTKTYTDTTVGLTEDHHHIGNFHSLDEFHTRLEMMTLVLCEGNDKLISHLGATQALHVPKYREVKETEELKDMVMLWCDEWHNRISLDFQVRQSLLS